MVREKQRARKSSAHKAFGGPKVGGRRAPRPRRLRPGTKALREIRKLQGKLAVNGSQARFVVAKAPFRRLVFADAQLICVTGGQQTVRPKHLRAAITVSNAQAFNGGEWHFGNWPVLVVVLVCRVVVVVVC